MSGTNKVVIETETEDLDDIVTSHYGSGPEIHVKYEAEDLDDIITSHYGPN